ncbi:MULTISPECIES: hypothetical protein [unclassified Bradyrhizobium]
MNRIRVELSVTVLAEDEEGAHRIVSRLLRSNHPGEEVHDPIEKITFGGISPGAGSPWRPAIEAPKDGKPFFAIDRGHGEAAAEFAVSVRWHAEQQSFVDRERIQPVEFSDWMAIPPA